MKTKPVVIITGANGFLGSNLVKRFSDLGWNVRALVRQPESFANTSSVEYIKFDLEKPENRIDEIFKGADYLIHTAYIKYKRENPRAFEENINAANKIIKASRKHHLLKNVMVSTMSAHSGAESVYAKQKLEIEKIFNSKRDVILRSGLIIGNGGIVKEMAQLMKMLRAVPLVGAGKQPLQIISIEDIVNIIQYVLINKNSGIYTVATVIVYTYKQFYKALAKRLGIKIVFIPLPYWVLKISFKVISFMRIPINIGSDNLLGLKNLISVDTTNDLKRLNVHLLDLEDSLAKISI